MPICYYCTLPNHTTAQCGRRRKDLENGIDRPFYPDRGQLQGGQYNHRVAQKLVKQGKAQNAAEALAQVERNEQARINPAKSAPTLALSASSATNSAPAHFPPRVSMPNYAQCQFPQQQFSKNNAPSHNQGNYNVHYYINPTSAAEIAPPQQQMVYPAPVFPPPASNPVYFLPPTPRVPDLRMVRPTQWADEVNTEASAEESRRANQVHNNLMF